MESSEQSVTYAEVARSQSLEDLAGEMQSRWARNFVDNGGPTRWIDKLSKMGARGYDSQTASKMEILWGVRHLSFIRQVSQRRTLFVVTLASALLLTEHSDTAIEAWLDEEPDDLLTLRLQLMLKIMSKKNK